MFAEIVIKYFIAHFLILYELLGLSSLLFQSKVRDVAYKETLDI